MDAQSAGELARQAASSDQIAQVGRQALTTLAGRFRSSCSRSGIAAIKLIARIPRSVSGPVEFLGKTTASVVGVTATSIDVGDTYFDSLPNGTITARQDASGASLAKTPEDLAFMTFVPGKCTYQLHFPASPSRPPPPGNSQKSALGHPDNGAGASVITQLDRRHQLRAVRHAAGHRHDRLGAQGRRPQDLHEDTTELRRPSKSSTLADLCTDAVVRPISVRCR